MAVGGPGGHINGSLAAELAWLALRFFPWARRAGGTIRRLTSCFPGAFNLGAVRRETRSQARPGTRTQTPFPISLPKLVDRLPINDAHGCDNPRKAKLNYRVRLILAGRGAGDGALVDLPQNHNIGISSDHAATPSTVNDHILPVLKRAAAVSGAVLPRTLPNSFY
jgi:hypothetical protein